MSGAVEVRERPILFSGGMVRAILDGRKTQTRRVVKPLRTAPLPKRWDAAAHGELRFEGAGLVADAPGGGRTGFPLPECPYGRPGDRLWVRETWGVSNIGWETPPDPPQPFIDLRYRADEAIREAVRCPEGFYWPEESRGIDAKWRPSIHMPRWASRITLQITDVRVQRLMDISDADALAEGYPHDYDAVNDAGWALVWFADLWDSINGARGYGWDANPWVWALTFRRV